MLGEEVMRMQILQPRGQKCVRYKLVYSKKLGKKVRRCAEFR